MGGQSMSHRLSFCAKHWWLILFSIAIIALGFPRLKVTKAQVSPPRSLPQRVQWFVTVDFTNVGDYDDFPDYTVTSVPPRVNGDCPSEAPDCLNISPGDFISWQAVTTKNSHKKMKHDLAVYLQDNILNDPKGAPTHTFRATDGNWTTDDGGGANATPDPTKQYEYCITVYDKVKKRVYADDPKIMIGGVLLDSKKELVEALGKNVSQLGKLVPEDSDAGKLVKNIQDLVNKLKQALNLQ
jgi:hypothetical protein